MRSKEVCYLLTGETLNVNNQEVLSTNTVIQYYVIEMDSSNVLCDIVISIDDTRGVELRRQSKKPSATLFAGKGGKYF